ncbi:MAG TPA: hypothetical protein PLI75_14565 [Anaerolineales bacterium]|nr:hypothetical protein [Anaerolineales bacterium]
MKSRPVYKAWGCWKVLFYLLFAACSPTPTTSPLENITVTATVPVEVAVTPFETESIVSAVQIRQSEVELITDTAATGDGGNIWGGHQTRVVRTDAGVFTAYTVSGKDELHRVWRLVRRNAVNDWVVVAEGDAGREPVNLLAAPDGTLYLVGWPEGVATLWAGKPIDGSVAMEAQVIPNMIQGNWPYSSAGIASDGTLCIVASNGGEEPGGEFYWSCYLPADRQWVSRISELDFRYCYTYVFPQADGQFALVSTRDVRWQALGYEQPADSFDYAFNAIGFWRTDDLLNKPLELISFDEEPPTAAYPLPFLNAQMDAYLDTHGNMHILYWREGQTTGGERWVMHRILSRMGEILFDERLPEDSGYFNRIFQDSHGRFYILGSSGLLYPLDENGEHPTKPIRIDLGGHEVEYSGYGLSVPRTGSALVNTIDVVFPSGNETQWLYFQIEFSE